MAVQKTIASAFIKSGVVGTAPFETAARRLLGLDLGDWSVVFLGLTFVGLLLTLA